MKPEKPMPELSDQERFQQRLGPADELQIRLLLRVPPAQRLRTMLEMQATLLNGWYARLRKSHPELSDLEVCRMMFERLKQNG
jgi:hypothetical protein